MKFNNSQFVFAREYRGIGQTDLSKKVKGLSQSNLSKFEKGFDVLSENVIYELINILDFPVNFFTKTINNDIEIAHYRKKSGITKENNTIIYNDYYNNNIIRNLSGRSHNSNRSNITVFGGSYGLINYFSNGKGITTNCIFQRAATKKNDPLNPFLNGKGMPIKNAGILRLLGKNGNGGFRNYAYNEIRGMKINLFEGTNDLEFDNDPVTGSFIKVYKTIIDTTYQQNGGSFLKFIDSEADSDV